jgi:DNA-binding NtrC family response regulator
MRSGHATEDSVSSAAVAAVIADLDPGFCECVRASVMGQGLRAIEVNTSRALKSAVLQHQSPIAVIGEFGDGTEAALQVVAALLQVWRECRIIFSPWHSSEETVIAAFRAGSADYLRRPLSGQELAASISRCAAGLPLLGKPLDRETVVPALVFTSTAMRSIVDFVVKVSKTNSNVLITGETGTGKEVLARLVHELSPRRSGPLISINCASLPDSLLESELFGYERGAFTGAASAFPGRLRAASGGTVVLDEIGDMTLAGKTAPCDRLQADLTLGESAKRTDRCENRRLH